MATLEQRHRRGVALVVGQVHLDSVAVEADPDATLDQPLDVAEVVRVAAVGDLHLRGIDSLLDEDLDLARAGLARGS